MRYMIYLMLYLADNSSLAVNDKSDTYAHYVLWTEVSCIGTET
jgi:hypothetical protein